ncbi:MAG: pyridoxamine 5'-phosphate oxidase family protein [Syntrophomonadaceae bacterium]|nr:pyridoxamine 5'-phosphate oxidase family protein [Syntrophomonadaceae bacterium]
MGKFLGDRLPENICTFFQGKTMTGIVSTVDEDGTPRGAPMSMFYALNDKFMLMAAQNRSRTFKNAQERGKIALTFVGAGDMAFTVQASARVFREQMQNSEHMGILLLEINTVKSDVACDVEVKEGIQITFRSPRWKEFAVKLLGELRSYSLEDVSDL